MTSHLGQLEQQPADLSLRAQLDAYVYTRKQIARTVLACIAAVSRINMALLSQLITPLDKSYRVVYP